MKTMVAAIKAHSEYTLDVSMTVVYDDCDVVVDIDALSHQ